jgi:hypothetical protein
MIDYVQVVGVLASVLLITTLIVRELRWPRRLGRLGRGAIGILFLIVISTATLRILALLFPPT